MPETLFDLLGAAALLAIGLVAGMQIGQKRGEAHTFRLHRHGVNLADWYREEPLVEAHAGVRKFTKERSA